MSARIEHRIGVAAPASAIWKVIADLERWGEWNPVYTQASGRLAIGDTIRFTLQLPEQKPMDLAGAVVDWVPNEQLIFKIKLFSGLVTITRFIEIDALSESGCIVANGEIQNGPGAGLVPGGIRRSIQRGMQAMNEALKARAESTWDGVPDPPLAVKPPAPPPPPKLKTKLNLKTR